MCQPQNPQNPRRADLLDQANLPAIDQIVRIDDRDKIWVRDNNLWPSSWELPAEELEAIRGGRILLSFLFSPTAVVNFPPPDCVGADPVPFVFVDATLMQDAHVGLSREELISVILHEFGHKMNPIRPEDLAEGQRVQSQEDPADDYSRHFGFGEHLARALEKLRDSGRPFFPPAEINRRVARIRNAEHHFLCRRLRQLEARR
jgi:Zn-dependent protease with chaperone function